MLSNFLFLFLKNVCYKQGDLVMHAHTHTYIYIFKIFFPIMFYHCLSLLLFSCSVMSDFLWPYGLQYSRLLCPSPSSQCSPKLMSIESVMPSSHLILCLPLLLPSIFPIIRVFSNEPALCITWPKYWSFSFKISPSNEHPGLMSFRMDCLDLLAVQGTLKSLLNYHSSKASILLHSAFFIV